MSIHEIVGGIVLAGFLIAVLLAVCSGINKPRSGGDDDN